MQIKIEKIPGLTKFTKLLHGISPRSYSADNNKKVEFNLNPNADNWHESAYWNFFLNSLRVPLQKPFFLNQVHSDYIYCIDEVKETSIGGVLMGDAIISNVPNRSIAIFTADCLPVIIYDNSLNAFGVIHAGRKGTSLGIVGKTIRKMIKKYGSDPKNIVIGFGPGIGGCCYEVGYECLESFSNSFLSIEKFAIEKKNNKYMLDLKMANRLDALKEDILEKNIFDCEICTVCNNNLFFSHRKKDLGRTMTIAMLLP